MMIAGALSGLGGAAIYTGYASSMQIGVMPSQASTASRSLLGANTPVGVVGAALFFGVLQSGKGFMNAMTDIPPEIGDTIIASIIYFCRDQRPYPQPDRTRPPALREARHSHVGIRLFISSLRHRAGDALITSLGGLFSERSGVVNIGLEGLMVAGGFASAAATSGLNRAWAGAAIWVSLVVAMVIGALFSVLHAFASINLNANQVISGTAINMIAGAVTVFSAHDHRLRKTSSSRTAFRVSTCRSWSTFRCIGKLFFYQTYGTTWLILAILALGAFLVLYKTAFGLRLRACGEHP